jgi:8-oxo-dGTP pyrophosphatase MutT (NUDIX family)
MIQIKNKKETYNAFQSLSFRGNRGYSKDFNRFSLKEVMPKSKTYGGIISVETEDGEEKYALVQGRYTGKWSFPKGHSNMNESPFECCLREIYEETSIKTLPIPINYIKSGYGHYFVFNLRDKMELIPRDTKEIMNTKWVTLDEMKKMSLNADVSMYLQQKQLLINNKVRNA